METEAAAASGSSAAAGPSAGTSGTRVPTSMPPFDVPPAGGPARNPPPGPEEPGAAPHARTRLHDIVKELDPNERLSDEVEDVLLELADDFVEATVRAACLSARHRRSAVVEARDVQLHLERHWNMWLPGFGTEEVQPYAPAAEGEAHRRRMELVREAVGK
ncbi:transcription initiation factor TFIID subunit 12-like [Schistocerca gregaria]|uniref:transcription initiation factor TFIID subunit 12-like n=1 Tax=Schistocerca gregaria TaxID=7010 RepID=UPI00211F1350|nr:transcription initiation factor TFIID subunit 12-like [Schistocerca gregaria]XP_049843999.1 transcription initiation factor TFIID subunit 12-like [Schistocerca gregaria]XP_049844000.1 transcription initiation factor TFIID subunit 12-like [Schistocerca gregaria]XP_049844001.1 transcription initiation factor TFIID subunit 12-like [Schistocerca gregaria]XP_049844002.1 transcription initiation factor TFIID subunit 12-like [Schistocerca gregaria]XP_049844003.1 transcription initiation factor TFI